jgi:hypothetical protein
MHNCVSNRHKTTPDDARLPVFRKPESNCAPDALQLLPVWPKEICDRTDQGRRKIIAIIERELRKERRRGIAGDRAYDLARHSRLVRLLKEEREALAKLIRR